MTLPVLIGIATIFYALYVVLVSRASNQIDPNLSSLIFNGIAAVLSLAAYFAYKSMQGAHLISATTSGIAYSAAAGVVIGIFTILMVKIFETGDVAHVSPLIYGGTIVITALIGWTLFQESVSWMHAAGVVLVVLGISLVVLSKMSAGH